MVIKNKLKKTIVSSDAIKAKRLSQAVKGLIGLSKPQTLIFSTRFGIHTFGVKFPIDVLILDEAYSVVKLKENLSSNKIFVWNPVYKLVIELPQGTIKKSKTTLGDSLQIS